MLRVDNDNNSSNNIIYTIYTPKQSGNDKKRLDGGEGIVSWQYHIIEKIMKQVGIAIGIAIAIAIACVFSCEGTKTTP
jgi:hypothetical protein